MAVTTLLWKQVGQFCLYWNNKHTASVVERRWESRSLQFFNSRLASHLTPHSVGLSQRTYRSEAVSRWMHSALFERELLSRAFPLWTNAIETYSNLKLFILNLLSILNFDWTLYSDSILIRIVFFFLCLV